MKTKIVPALGFDDEDQDETGAFKPLTAEEARQWYQRHPSISPWWVVAGQAGVGLLVALAAWLLTQKPSAGWSAGYGALAVLIPAALFARGIKGRFSSLNAGTAVLAFFLWEMVKLVVTFAMLVAAPRLVPELNWLALLAGLFLAMKVYWVALLYAPER